MSPLTGRVIRGEEWVGDDWILAAEDDLVPPGAKLIVGFDRYTAHPESFAAAVAIGLLLPNTMDVVESWPSLSALPLIALQIPKFGDGRAYSQASLLRERCGYKGELRAIGDVLVDQLHYLRRCGFDVLVPRGDQDPDACLRALKGFSSDYQSAADHAPSIWQRRRTTAAG